MPALTPSSLASIWPLDWHEGGRSWWAPLGDARVAIYHEPGNRFSCRLTVTGTSGGMTHSWDGSTPEEAVSACRDSWREWATRTAGSLRRQADALDALAAGE